MVIIYFFNYLLTGHEVILLTFRNENDAPNEERNQSRIGLYIAENKQRAETKVGQHDELRDRSRYCLIKTYFIGTNTSLQEQIKLAI